MLGARTAHDQSANETASAQDVRLVRAKVLAACKAADSGIDSEEPRNLVLFFDGTGNILGHQAPTNVVRLMEAATQDPLQLVFYDPGVGSQNTFPGIGVVERLRQRLAMLHGLAAGTGVFENIAAGYQFLVENYQPGDRIFLFGFSRGAFTARAVGGFINMFGIVRSGALQMLPSMVDIYFSPTDAKDRSGVTRDSAAVSIRTIFSMGRTPLVHFVGVWDTVESIGFSPFGSRVRITNPATVANKYFRHVRHALALHELRTPYRQRVYVDPQYTADELVYRSFKEQWFRGVHSDIGGGYLETGLSDITLGWMASDARQVGLRLQTAWQHSLTPDPSAARHDQVLENPFWFWGGLDTRRRAINAEVHPSAQPIDGSQDPHSLRLAKPGIYWLGCVLTIGMCTAIVAMTFPHTGYRKTTLEVLVLLLAIAWLCFPASWIVRSTTKKRVVDGTALPILIARANFVVLAAIALAAIAMTAM